MNRTVERGLYLKFCLDPNAIHGRHFRVIRNYIEREQPGNLPKLFEALSKRLASDKEEAEYLIEEITRLPEEFKERATTKAVLADHIRIAKGVNEGRLN